MSSACPVPTATTRTSRPVSFVKAGSRCENNPDCSVDVVDATVIESACAVASDNPSSSAAIHFMPTLP